MNIRGTILASAVLILAFVSIVTIGFDGLDAEDTYIAEIDGHGYTTLQDAVDNSGIGDTIKLIGDIDSMSTVTISDGKELTIDLNGHTIQTALNASNNLKHQYALDNYGKLTLMDSSDSQSGIISARGIENLGNGVMTIESGTYLSIDKGNGGAAVWNTATLFINGGTFRSTYAGSASDDYGAGCLNNSGSATIVGGTFEGESKRTYAIISTGTLLIDPAIDDDLIVSGAHGGLAVDSGVAVVNGGSFSSSDYYGLYVSNDGVGIDPKTAMVTVNGGNYTGLNYSVWIGSDYNNPVNSSIEINGGTFLKPLNAQENTREGAILVKGGEFSTDVSQYIPTGYVCKQINKYYHVAIEVPPSDDDIVSSDESSIITDFGTSDKATIDLPSVSITMVGTNAIGNILVSAVVLEDLVEAPDAIASFEITIVASTDYVADITVVANIPHGQQPIVYYIDDVGNLVPVKVVSYTHDSVTFRTTHTTPFVVMTEDATVTPGGEEEEDYPFFPGQGTNVGPQDSGSEDNTKLVAAAAAIVVIMLAVVALMVTRNN